jgi:hypothetical protein
VYQDHALRVCYAGGFERGKRHGRGQFFHFDGRREEAVYREGQRVE